MTGITAQEHASRALSGELDVLRSRKHELAEALDGDDVPGDRADQADAIERASELQAIEARIAEITRLLASSADPADPTPADQVGPGSVVTLRYTDGTTGTVRIGIVVEDDAAVVTPESPLGHALLGRRTGQDIAWSTPAGERQARVIQLSQP
ncbi:MAG: GreA/GreB family elongation factor [Pseudonocardiaceae bacterium]